MLQTHSLLPQHLILPLFVAEGAKSRVEIEAMPGVFRYSVDSMAKVAEEALEAGVRALLLFGIPEKRDEEASESYNPDGIVPKALRALKKRFPELVLFSDVCVCAYTKSGHCGVLFKGREWEVDNDRSLELLQRQALAHAEAGADFVAPSAMMDGQVAALREALDAQGFSDVGILAYAAKFASAFYGPFREACDSAPQKMSRASYQMSGNRVEDALREIALDVAEGADAVMVKPLLGYLDVVRAAKEEFELPIAGYNVSGEYSMVKAAAARGWLDEKKAVLELFQSFRRAGCDWVISYFALQAARWLPHEPA